MAAPFTGSTGWTGLHPFQLGGPPLISSWSRPVPTKALPLKASVYGNDGVTFLGSFAPLNRPEIATRLANGGPQEQLTLEVDARPVGSAYGVAVYGISAYGGTGVTVTHGNVIRLSEVGGPWKGFVYSGVAESFPDVNGADVHHQIVLAAFAVELTRVAIQLAYTAPTDVAQVVRDAVRLTGHCSCDQISVPAATGIMVAQNGAVDFRGQKVAQVLDTVRSIAGPRWFWHCDELGRVWFQPQGSGAVYTLMGGIHYEERTSNGGDIAERINQVPAVGGVPVGGAANVQVTVDGSSQAAIGVRTLDPPIQVPGVADQATLTAIATGILGTLDQVWTRIQLRALPPTGNPNERHPGRIHASQPGGATLRYWESTVNPMPESSAGAGYVGPFIGQSSAYDGLYQRLEAGSAPVTSSSDVDNLVKTWANRTAANALVVTAASLNLPNQTLAGSFQSSAAVALNGQPAGAWRLDPNQFALYDANGVRRVAQGNLPANGISPAGYKFEVDDASGNPLFDSFGLIAVMKSLGTANNPGGNPTFTTTTPTVIPGVSVSFNLARQVRVLAFAVVTGTSSGQTGIVDVFLDGVDQGSPIGGSAQNEMQWGFNGPTVTSSTIFSENLGAGNHTIDLRAYVSSMPGTFTVQYASLLLFQLGS
jgi:hypothetical protein